MAVLRLLAWSITLPCFLQMFASGNQQCVPLRGSIFEACTAAGYNSTFPIPDDIKLTVEAKRMIRWYSDFLMQQVKNCSVASMGESVMCSIDAPYCRTQDNSPFLPCQRVCSEFLKRCEGTVENRHLEYFITTCSLLPNSTADTGKCYEPPEFYKHYNYSTKGLLEGSCSPVLFPFCKGLGFNYTSLSANTQIIMYRFFYGKNFTNTSTDVAMLPTSFVQRLQWLLNNHSDCSVNLKKLLCGSFLPPCFPKEGFALYTLCQPLCHEVISRCPAILNTDWKHLVANCEMLAYGNTSHGFCKHTSFPPPMQYLKHFHDFDKLPPASSPEPTVKPYVIAVAVIVPIILIALIILSFVFWRRRHHPLMFMRGIDKELLVDE